MKRNNNKGKVRSQKYLTDDHRPIKKEELDRIVEALFKVPPPPKKKK